MRYALKRAFGPPLVPPPAPENVEPDPDDDSPRTVTRIPWAELLRLTFRVDVARRGRCVTGTVAVIAFITDLRHLLRYWLELLLIRRRERRGQPLPQGFASGKEAVAECHGR